MSVTEPGRMREPTEVRGRTTEAFHISNFRETKPSFMTTEFWAMLIGIAALVVIYNASHDATLNLWRASALATTLAVGYLVSRGIAKSGTHDQRTRDDDRRH